MMRRDALLTAVAIALMTGAAAGQTAGSVPPDKLNIITAADTARTIEAYSKLAAADPTDGTNYYVLGLAYFKQGNLEMAIKSFKKATELSPGDDDGHYALGLCLRRSEEYSGAVAAFKSAVEMNPGAPEIHDGQDNQCPGDYGYGTADEISGVSGFFNPDDRDEFSWPFQSGATVYQVVRSPSPLFDSSCVDVITSLNEWVDTDTPLSGEIFHYLDRPYLPSTGSWGPDSAGNERAVPCIP